MSLSRKIADAAEHSAGPGLVAAADGDAHVEIDLTLAGPVGLQFDALRLRVADGRDRTVDDLRAWGDRIAARVTYLMEPLVVHEADAPAAEVALRSKSPTATDDRRAFYEVRLSGPARLTFGRLAFDEADRRRQPAPIQLTGEVLRRLVDDLVGTLD